MFVIKITRDDIRQLYKNFLRENNYIEDLEELEKEE